MPVAELGQALDDLIERRREVQDQVVVAQRLVFNEIDSH
jgi:hypothetical protein